MGRRPSRPARRQPDAHGVRQPLEILPLIRPHPVRHLHVARIPLRTARVDHLPLLEECQQANDILLALLGSNLVGGRGDLLPLLLGQPALDQDLRLPILGADVLARPFDGDAVGLRRVGGGAVTRVVAVSLDRVDHGGAGGNGDQVPVGVTVAAGLGLHEVEVPGAGGAGG